MGERTMTQYSDIVEETRTALKANKWAKGIRYIHANNGIIETKFNNGDVHYKETKDKGKSWTIFKNLPKQSLIDRFLRRKAPPEQRKE